MSEVQTGIQETNTGSYTGSEQKAILEEGGVKVRLLTQNIFMRPPLINNNGDDFKQERLDWFIKNVLDKYDVICLEEMFKFGSGRKTQLIKAAKARGLVYNATTPSKGFFDFGIDSGLLILSRYPIEHKESIQYPRGVHSDALSLKGALYARIKVEKENNLSVSNSSSADSDSSTSKYLNIFVTHTQASYTNTALTEPSVRVRLSQFHMLRKFMDKVLKTTYKVGEPLIILGDLNVNSRTHIITDETRKFEDNEKDGIDHSTEYTMMMNILRGVGIGDPKVLSPKHTDTFSSEDKLVFKDIIYESYKYHPVTFGNIIISEDGETAKPMEKAITSKDSNMVMDSIDYILWYEGKANPDTSSEIAVKSKYSSVRVEEFFAENEKFTQLSGK
ncbi:Sphingomyelinase [Zancudomyces culisetae]|uniref:sphingomyelin phosphodiesterase n=1 Tax=Zancudomyces culisetae TaxID=1213189 RepID=A0A1R1PZM2_ZANCU|nr:Sphingomyelinase [Zancudomyces culisetae]|eukprot:OMH86387.1 Sphingomyelinase [Zancudomyces culisetae]